MSELSPIIVWFRQDLRLCDNPALCYAVKSGRPVVFLYIYDPKAAGKWQLGGAGCWWLHHSLASLQQEMTEHQAQLILRTGAAEKTLDAIIQETGAAAVVWNRQYEPWAVDRDKKIKASLQDQGIEVNSFKASVLFEPWEIKTKTSGSFYKVYTPFMKACRERAETIRPPFEMPHINNIAAKPSSQTLEDLALLPTKGWDAAFYDVWTPGEAGAERSLTHFLNKKLNQYAEGRNYPAESQEAVSRLSPHLHFGDISPFQIWQAIHQSKADYEPDGRTYANEILWREFAYHLLYNLPDFPDQPMNKKFADFEWRKSDKHLTAWQQGQTGYPIIDAGMRQLWQTGWMHNRVRMIVGSFLVKDLQIDWRHGAAWFWDTLVDADLASNTMGWQWVAGCGPDAAPFFRIFNPVTQSRKFDPDGDYIRHYVPELADMPDKYIHAPWTAPENIRKSFDYPPPVVDHAQMRKLALEKYKAIK